MDCDNGVIARRFLVAASRREISASVQPAP